MIANPAGHGAPPLGPRRFLNLAELVARAVLDFGSTAHVDGGRYGLHFNAVGTVLRGHMRYQRSRSGMSYRNPDLMRDLYGRIRNPAYPDVRHRNLPPGGRRRIFAQHGVDLALYGLHILGLDFAVLLLNLNRQACGAGFGFLSHRGIGGIRLRFRRNRCRLESRFGAGSYVSGGPVRREEAAEVHRAPNDASRASLRLARIIVGQQPQQSVRIGGRELHQAEGAEMDVQVRSRTVARVAGQAQQFTPRHLLAWVHVDLRQMAVRVLEARAAGSGPDAHLVAVRMILVVIALGRAAALPFVVDMAHAARGHGVDRRAFAAAPVNAFVTVFFLARRLSLLAVQVSGSGIVEYVGSFPILARDEGQSQVPASQFVSHGRRSSFVVSRTRPPILPCLPRPRHTQRVRSASGPRWRRMFRIQFLEGGASCASGSCADACSASRGSPRRAPSPRRRSVRPSARAAPPCNGPCWTPWPPRARTRATAPPSPLRTWPRCAPWVP